MGVFIFLLSCGEGDNFDFLEHEIDEGFLSSELTQLEHKAEIEKILDEKKLVKIGSKKNAHSVNLSETVGKNNLKDQEESNPVRPVEPLPVKETKKTMTDDFIQALLQSENWDQPELLFNEIKEYFDFRIIGHSLIRSGYKKFSQEEFNDFVEVFPLFEVYKILPHIKKLSRKELAFKLLSQSESEKEYGTFIKFNYKYDKKSVLNRSSNNAKRFSLIVFKMNNQDNYKIVNLGLNGVNWLSYRRNYYNNLINMEKSPREIIDIIKSKLKKEAL